MTIKNDETLAKLAEKVNTTPSMVAAYLVRDLKRSEMVEDTEENFGCKLKDCIEEDVPVSDLVALLDYQGLEVTYEILNLLLNLVIMGDFDCPHCGGRMVVVDEECECDGDGVDLPEYYITKWEEVRCENCGHSEIKYYER